MEGSVSRKTFLLRLSNELSKQSIAYQNEIIAIASKCCSIKPIIFASQFTL